MLQKLALVEEKKALFRQRLQMEKLGHQRRQLLKQQHELASLHSSRRILLHCGWMPWSRLLLACRERLQSARGYYKRRIAKSAVHVLYIHTVDGKTTPRQHARSLSMQAAQFRKKWQLLSWWYFWINMRRADHIYPHGLLRRALISLKEELLELRSLEKFADERNCIRLYHQMWCVWKQYVSSEKSAKLLKYLETDQKASLHARRARHVRVLKAWKEGLAVLHYEKERSLHKAEAWIKIHSWLNGLHQEKSCQLD
ncbi:hypothetical protein CY35_16G027400 [Sphagnum magellanicum]|nr:hypothetical protein CY35_16G027400 [Sphagnum magellanicum]